MMLSLYKPGTVVGKGYSLRDYGAKSRRQGRRLRRVTVRGKKCPDGEVRVGSIGKPDFVTGVDRIVREDEKSEELRVKSEELEEKADEEDANGEEAEGEGDRDEAEGEEADGGEGEEQGELF